VIPIYRDTESQIFLCCYVRTFPERAFLSNLLAIRLAIRSRLALALTKRRETRRDADRERMLFARSISGGPWPCRDVGFSEKRSSNKTITLLRPRGSRYIGFIRDYHKKKRSSAVVINPRGFELHNAIFPSLPRTSDIFRHSQPKRSPRYSLRNSIPGVFTTYAN